jgi:heme-degrading monooxygenase HmoA
MVTYIATIWAKPGHENEVTRFYQDLEPLMRAAKGYRGRKILRARTGTMAAAVRKLVTAEEAARHAEHAAPGTQFIMVEEWDSVEDRVAFSRGASASRGKDLFPHILPDHSHEFYEDVSPA